MVYKFCILCNKKHCFKLKFALTETTGSVWDNENDGVMAKPTNGALQLQTLKANQSAVLWQWKKWRSHIHCPNWWIDWKEADVNLHTSSWRPVWASHTRRAQHWTDLFLPADSAKDCPSSALEWNADADDSPLNLAISKRDSFLRRFFLMNNGWPNYLLISQHCVFRLISADCDRFVYYSHFSFPNRLKKYLSKQTLVELSSNVIIAFTVSSCAQCECACVLLPLLMHLQNGKVSPDALFYCFLLHFRNHPSHNRHCLSQKKCEKGFPTFRIRK